MSYLKNEVLDIEPSDNVAELTCSMSKGGFGARKIGEAIEIFRNIIDDEDCYTFLGVAGALVPCGLRKILSQMISRNYVDLVVSTGANITHDLALAFGGKQYQLRDQMISDFELRRKGYVRVYDVCIPSQDFEILENKLSQILKDLSEDVYGSYDLILEIGKKVEDKDSIVRNAFQKNVPIIVPAFIDSIVGLQVWTLNQNRKIRLDSFKDLSFMINKQFDLKSQGKRSAALFLGGGVPKNFIMQSALTADKPLDYAIQIVTDRPEYGGLSGATLDEAKSWKKVHTKAKICTVNCDVSIALPIILSAIINK